MLERLALRETIGHGTVCAGEALRVAHAPKPGGGACSQSVFAPVGSFLKVEEEKLSLFLTESDAPLITVIMDPKGRPLHVRKDHNPEEMEPHE